MAGSTYSSNLKIELMTTGENSGTWGDITNTNLGTALEQAIVGYGNPDYVSDANLTISITNSNAAQAARALVLNVTSVFGSLTATRELVVPTIQKQYIVQNNTTGGQSITVKTSAGTGITVPNGRKAHLYVDGTNVIQMFDFVDINGGTIDGTAIGGSSAAAGAFTTLAASGATTLNGAVTLGDATGDNITINGTVTSHLLFTDNTYDIGASGATRPRNLYLAGAATIGGNLSVGGTLTLTGGLTLNGNVTVGDSAADTLTINSTITSNLIFTDNTYDIGASGATRPRNLYLAGSSTTGGNATITGSLAVDSTTDSTSATTGSIQTDGGVGIAKALFVGTTVTIDGGTANGVAYLNGSKVLTSGSALTFDGTGFGVITSAPTITIYETASGNNNRLIISQSGTATTYNSTFSSGSAEHVWQTGNAEQMRLTSTALTVDKGAVFNESGGDYDFRVESDTNTHALFVDAGTSYVGVNTSGGVYAPFEVVTISTAGKPTSTNIDRTTANWVRVTNPEYSTNASAGVLLRVFPDSDVRQGAGIYATGGSNNAASDLYLFASKDGSGGSALTSTSYAGYYFNGESQSQTFLNAAGNSLFFVGPTSVVVNEDSGDIDFRVESDNSTHMLFVDAGNNRVGINQSSPSNVLDISGSGSGSGIALNNFGITNGGRYIYDEAYFNVGTLSSSGAPYIGYAVRANYGVANAYVSTTPIGVGRAAIDVGAGGNGNIQLWTGGPQTPSSGSSLTDWHVRLSIDPDGNWTQNSDGGTAVVFNEDGVDQDFRVESDTNAYAFFVDAGNSRVAINTSDTANATFTVAGPGTSTATTAFFANVDGTYNPYLQIQNLGSAGMKLLSSSSYGGSSSRLNFDIAGADCLNLTPAEVAINDGSADMDFRVESDTNTHALFVDAGNSRVGINDSAPTKSLSVSGVPYISNSGYAFLTIDRAFTSGVADFTFGELNGNCDDNFAYLVIVSVYDPSTSTTDEHAGYVGFRITPRGGGGVLTQIVKTQASNITTFTVATNGDGMRVTTDTTPALRCRVIVLGGGGTTTPSE